MFLNNSAKEALISIVSWYDGVNGKGCVTIDDLSRLKILTDFAKDILDADKEMSDNENSEAQQAVQNQQAFDFIDPYGVCVSPDDDVPF